MIVQDLYSGTLRLNELLRESEGSRTILQNQIHLLDTALQLRQADLDVCEENIRYLEKQAEALKSSLIESDSSVNLLLAERDDLQNSNRNLEHRAIQAESLFSALKHQTDSANMRRIMYRLKVVKDTQRHACTRESFLGWKMLRRRHFRRKMFDKRIESVNRNFKASIFHMWVSLQLFCKLESEMTRTKSLAYSFTDISAQIIECQQDSINIVKSVEDENRKASLIVNAIYAEVENQMKSDRVKRMLVRVQRVIKYWNNKITKRAHHTWVGFVKSKRIKRKKTSVCNDRILKSLFGIKNRSWRAWADFWRLSRTIAMRRKLAVPFLLKNIHHGRMIALLNIGEKNHSDMEDFPNGLKSLEDIKALLHRASCLTTLRQRFASWREVATLLLRNRGFLQQTLLVRSSFCRCSFRKYWVQTAEKSDVFRIGCFGNSQDIRAVNHRTMPALPFNAAFAMKVLNRSELVGRFFNNWIFRRFKKKRQNWLLRKVEQRYNSWLSIRHFWNWTNHQRAAEKLTIQLRVEAIAQELVSMAELKVSAEVRLAIANDHLKLLEESSMEQVAARQNLEIQSDQVVGMLQDLQWKCEEQEQSRTVTRVLRVLSYWTRSRARCTWKRWSSITRRTRIRAFQQKRSLCKVSRGRLRSAFAIWNEYLANASARAEEEWANSLQQQLVALAGLQATTENQLDSMANENAALRESIACTAFEIEKLQNTISIVYSLQASRFWKARTLRCKWITWCGMHFKRLSMRSIIRQFFMKKIVPVTTVTMLPAKVSSGTMISMHTLLVRIGICRCWKTWKVRRSFTRKYHCLRRRCEAAYIPRTRDNAFVSWLTYICERKEKIGRDALQLLGNIVESLSTAAEIQKIFFPCKISKGGVPLSERCSKMKRYVSAPNLSFDSNQKATLWLLVQFVLKAEFYFDNKQCTHYFLGWNVYVMRNKKNKRAMKHIAMKRLRYIIACALQLWVEWHCETMADTEQMRFQSHSAGLKLSNDVAKSVLNSPLQTVPSLYGSQDAMTVRFGHCFGSTFAASYQFRTVKRWLEFVGMEKGIQESYLQSEIEKFETKQRADNLRTREFEVQVQSDANLKMMQQQRAFDDHLTALQIELQNTRSSQEDLQRMHANAEQDLGFLRIILKQGQEKYAVARIMQVLRFWKLLALRTTWNAIKIWIGPKLQRHQIAQKVVVKHFHITKSQCFSLWMMSSLQSKNQSNALRIKALEDNVVQALQLKDAAENRIFSMVELKQEIEKNWNQKHCTTVQGLERRLAETKKQFDALESKCLEKYLSSASTRVVRVLIYFQHSLCQHMMNIWRQRCHRKRFLRKTVRVFLECILIQTFDWWASQAEMLKAQALEVSACSLEQQLISVNERLHRRLHTSEAQVRYVLEEQEQVQKVWDLRHRALRNNLEMQLAHANQMRVSIGKMYADLRREVSTVRIMRVLKFWSRLSAYRIFSEIKFWVLHKRKCRRLYVRSVSCHSLQVCGRFFCFWESFHFETSVTKLKNIIIETQLSAVKEINAKERDISLLIGQLRETMTCSREISSQLAKASSTARLVTVVSTEMPDLSKFKAEAEALRLEAEHQALYRISSPRILK